MKQGIRTPIALAFFVMALGALADPETRTLAHPADPRLEWIDSDPVTVP